MNKIITVFFVCLVFFVYLVFFVFNTRALSICQCSEDLDWIINHKIYNNFNTRGLIISHCSEDLDWIINDKIYNNFNNIYLYTKCEKQIPQEITRIPNITVEKLLNSGQEGSTYLYHIIKYWNNLENYNVFVTGKGSADTRRKNFYDKNVLVKSGNKNNYNEYQKNKIDLEFTLSDYKPTNNKLNNIPFIKSKYNSLYDFCKDFLNDNQLDKLKEFEGVSYAGNFAINYYSIHKNPLELYKKLYTLVDIGPNNEIVHFLERLWVFIFESN